MSNKNLKSFGLVGIAFLMAILITSQTVQALTSAGTPIKN